MFLSLTDKHNFINIQYLEVPLSTLEHFTNKLKIKLKLKTSLCITAIRQFTLPLKQNKSF